MQARLIAAHHAADGKSRPLNTGFLRKPLFALSFLLAAGAAIGVRAAGEIKPTARAMPAVPAIPVVPPLPLRTLEDFLARDWYIAKSSDAANGTKTPSLETPVASLLTFSHLFPALLVSRSAPQTENDGAGEPWTGAAGITRTVSDIMAQQAALDAAGQGVIMREAEDEHEYPVFNPQPDADTVFSANWPPSQTVLLGTSRKRDRQNPQTVGPVNFRAVQANASGYTPPDTQAAVGPSQILMIVNGRIISFSKNGGASGGLNASADTFFASVWNNSPTVDPRVRYDRLSQRWFVSSITTNSASNRIVLAVSSGPVISGASSFTFYQFAFDQPTPTSTADTGGFADYDTLAVDANALYIGSNIFKGNFVGSTLFVLRKSSVLSGGPLVVTPFREVGLYTPQGADNDNPNAATGYIVGPNTNTSGRINLLKVLNPGGTPTLTAVTSISVPATASPTSAPALGSTNNLDGLDLRMFAAQVHRNALTGSTTLWTAHTNKVNASGIASGGDRDAVRWYEIQNLDGTGTGTNGPNLRQSGTLFDPAASSPLFFLAGTVAMSGQGAMALGASVSSAASTAKVAVAGRLITDPAGATQSQNVLALTTGTYNGGRWGDYSYTMVDPQDDMTFWTAQMYADSANNWAVQILQLKSPPPPTITGVSPSPLPLGAATSVTVTGTSAGSAAFFNPLPEYTNHLAVTTNAPGVTLSNVAIVIPAAPTTTPVTQITFTATIPAATPPGNYNLTITNPDGQSVTGTALLTVGVPPPVLTSLSPASAVAGRATLLLTVNGSNFASNSIVNFNGLARTTTFVNSGQLTATVPASALTNVGTFPVTVSTTTSSGTATSNTLNFAVNQVSVAGSIALQGLTSSPAPLFAQSIDVDFRAPGKTTVLFTRTATIGVSNTFSFSGLPPGVYDIAFKGVKYLRSVLRSVNVSQTSTAGANVSLTVGDSTDDNSIDIGDFGVLVNAYNTAYDSANPLNGYDTLADFNDDGAVDIADFGLLVNSYGLIGAP